MSDLINKFKQLADGSLTDKEFMEGLGPGCKYEKTEERETRLVPDKPVEHWVRTCRAVHSCDDSSDNVSKYCEEWRKDW